jgi:hypothetical protein
VAVGSDNNAEIQVLWDSERLHVAYAVQDATQRINAGGADGELWNGDGIELTIDASASRALTPDQGDYHIGVNVFGEMADARGTGSSPEWDTSWTSGAERAVRRTASGYTVELAIPWSAVGIVPGAGTEVGFDVAVNDSDAAGAVKQFDWAGLTRFAQPARWGRLALAAPATKPGLPGAGPVTADRSVDVASCAMAPPEGRGTPGGVHLPVALLGALVLFASRRGPSQRR